ncbi:DUF2252 family protein [Cupriavidus necator]
MDPLEVWYARLDAETLIAMAPDEKAKKFREQIAAKARQRVIEHLFPKIAEEAGGRLRLVDQPPLVYHVTDADIEEGFREGLIDYRQTLSDERRVLLDRYRLEDFATESGGYWQCGNALLHGTVFRRRRASPAPPDQGSLPVCSRALCGQEPL